MKTIIFLFLFLCVQLGYAQKMKLPERKHNPNNAILELRDYIEDYPFEYTLGYSQMKFINATYGENSANSGMKPLYGYHLNVRYNKALPLILELGYSSSILDTKSSPYFDFPENEKISFKAIKAGANLTLLPTLNFFVPYVGFGYGYFSNTVGDNLLNTEQTTFRQETTAMSFWKAGFSINFHGIFYVNAEYEQALKIDNPQSYSQLNLGIGMRLDEDNLYRNHRNYLEDSPVDYSFGYSLSQLNNTAFAENSSNDFMQHKYGYYFNLRINSLLPFIFDFGYKSSVFELTEANYFAFSKNQDIYFTAFEGGVNLTLPAKAFIMPYIGAGYGLYSLSSKLNTQTNKQAFLKAGFTLNLHRNFFVNAEYKQSMKASEEFSHNQVNAGIGFRINGSDIFTGNVKEDFQDNGGIILSAGYNETNFLNKTFKNNIDQGKIVKAGGANVNLRIASTYPVMIDLGYFSSKFEIADMPSYPNDSTKVNHRGGELSIMLPLLSATRYFVPYVGGGYQYSELYSGKPFVTEEGKDYEDIIEMSAITSSPIYKVGLMINFSMLSWSVEYKHSVFNNDYPFYQLTANVGFKF